MKKIAAALSICIFVLRPEPVSAQLEAAKVGEMLLSAVIHGLIGHGIKSIFEGDAGVTPDQLKKVLENKLRSYRVEEIKDQVSGLKNQLGLYDPGLGDQTRGESIQGILSRTSDLEASLYRNITKGQFWELFPDYLFVTNIRLGFLAERALFEPETYDGKKILAQEAASAMKYVREMWENDFVDNTDYNCVRKTKRIHFYNRRGKFIPDIWVHDGKMACKSDINWILRRAGVSRALLYFPNQDYWKKRRILRRPGHNTYYYVYKKHADKDEYWLGFHHAENDAKRSRVRNSIGKYPKKLGKVDDTLHDWWRIVRELGDSDSKQDADQDGRYMLRRPR